jgi:hypothetical protein
MNLGFGISDLGLKEKHHSSAFSRVDFIFNLRCSIFGTSKWTGGTTEQWNRGNIGNVGKCLSNGKERRVN